MDCKCKTLKSHNSYRQKECDCCDVMMHYLQVEVRHAAGEGWGAMMSPSECRIETRMTLNKFAENLNDTRAQWLQKSQKQIAWRTGLSKKQDDVNMLDERLKRLRELSQIVADMHNHVDPNVPLLYLPESDKKAGRKKGSPNVSDKAAAKDAAVEVGGPEGGQEEEEEEHPTSEDDVCDGSSQENMDLDDCEDDADTEDEADLENGADSEQDDIEAQFVDLGENVDFDMYERQPPMADKYADKPVDADIEWAQWGWLKGPNPQGCDNMNPEARGILHSQPLEGPDPQGWDNMVLLEDLHRDCGIGILHSQPAPGPGEVL